jgi:hypothetical protein
MHKGAGLQDRPNDSWSEIYGKVESNIEEICPGEGLQARSYHEIQGSMRAAYMGGQKVHICAVGRCHHMEELLMPSDKISRLTLQPHDKTNIVIHYWWLSTMHSTSSWIKGNTSTTTIIYGRVLPCNLSHPHPRIVYVVHNQHMHT